MNTHVDYPFVCVHLKGEKQVFGYQLTDGSWAITVCWMTCNDQLKGHNVQINHAQVEMIEALDIAEAPWNTKES